MYKIAMEKENTTLSIKEIIPYENNAKKHSDSRIEESIENWDGEYAEVAQLAYRLTKEMTDNG